MEIEIDELKYDRKNFLEKDVQLLFSYCNDFNAIKLINLNYLYPSYPYCREFSPKCY